MSEQTAEGGAASGSAPPPHGALGKIERTARALIRLWALVGGAIILVLVVVTAASALSNLFLRKPFLGEYELAKHFVGIAIFTFMPYCQLSGANVTVDIFTEGMGARAKAAMALLSGVLALMFSVVLLRQMSIGFGDYIRYPEETPTLQIPLWTAFPPILFSIVLWVIAAVISVREAWSSLQTPTTPPTLQPSPH